MDKTIFQREVMQMLGVSEKEVSPVPLEKEGQFYSIAFTFYEKGDYRSAAKLFTQLVLTNPFSEHYWQGLASSKQMAHNHLAALHAWSLVALLKEGDPLPHFHAAECFFSLEEKQEASKALNIALKLCKDEGLRERIHTLKKAHHVDN
jgi:type III secretion system low calcium response chaperone LcrH/SycD